MNEFIQQFIIESRELAEQAISALEVLERSPHDAEHLDALFRAFHTLKGGASIVEFAAMERAVHAVENLLSDTRSAKRTVTPALIADCLVCLDQVAKWLDRMEQSGQLPSDADAQARAIVDRVASAAQHGSTSIAANPVSQNWLDEVLRRNEAVRQESRTAVRFTPLPDSFFRGIDPIAIIASLPGLLALNLAPVSEWPSLNALDPFESILVLTALTASSAREVSEHLRNHSGECEILALQPDESAGARGALSQFARQVLEAQIALLDGAQSVAFAGRVASAGIVAANVFRSLGDAVNAELISQATQRSLGEKDPRSLQQQIAQVLAPLPSASPTADETKPRTESLPRTLRVDAERIDALVRLTGELTVVKNAIGHATRLAQAEANSFAGLLKDQHVVLDRITSEIQRAVLGMRVLPLRTVLQRFPRVARDMSANLGKPVKLVIEGDDTEADKAIVEMLFEPLLHIVRNSMDHGIESASVRARRNKPATATLCIRASRQGDHVVIEVDDDGGGVDIARVRQVAQEREVVAPTPLEAMSDAEVVDLVFAPGFSTASKVTELSGRGVGMDAVRTAVGRVGGRVSLNSRAGRGTTVRFTLPFSVMMTHVMTVEAGGQMFGIPLDAVVETIRVPVESIVGVGTAQAIVRRDRTVPVFELANLLRLRPAAPDAREALIVVASFAGQLCGIHVDRIGERTEVMLKPLDGLLTGISGVIGTTILGDGRVLLVLDLDGVLQ
jgi:two-component system, chemotaxis family, sensor kinase CheA